MHIVHI